VQLLVGRVEKIDSHPNADSLYVSLINVGQHNGGKPLTVCSGLRIHGRDVVLATNLKPTKLRGIVSEAMVLAGTNSTGQVELVNAPTGSVPGTRLAFEGIEYSHTISSKPIKSSVWSEIQKQLFINTKGEVILREDTNVERVLKDQQSNQSAHVDTFRDGTVS
jgi:aminoacyl tRNA synthase complex-interacting multifunctional protein 1